MKTSDTYVVFAPTFPSHIEQSDAQLCLPLLSPRTLNRVTHSCVCPYFPLAHWTERRTIMFAPTFPSHIEQSDAQLCYIGCSPTAFIPWRQTDL